MPADVVTLALAGDINNIVNRGKSVPKDWQTFLPHNSTPYQSTIIFVVRPGNPKNIKDWGDLVQGGNGVPPNNSNITNNEFGITTRLQLFF